MGKAKVVNYYNDRFCGSMSAEQCDILEELIEADKQNGVVYDLKHIIYDLDEATVQDIIDEHGIWGRVTSAYEKPYGELSDYQTLAVCFMYYAQRCILGDSVGMGKTVETAGVLNLLKRERAAQGKRHRYLVLTQKNLATQFRAELIRFTGDFVDLVPSAEQKPMAAFTSSYPYNEELPYDIVGTHGLLTCPSFIQWLELARRSEAGFPFDTLIIDESSELGNSTTQVSTAFKSLSKYFGAIYFLNATPFESKLDIFYNQLNMLDPELLPTKINFTKEYCILDHRGMYPKAIGRYKNAAQFKALVGYRYFARTRRDKGASMTDCDGRIVLSKLSDIQKVWLKRSQMHRMVIDCPSSIEPSIEFNETNVPKLASLHDLLRNECNQAESVIIFSHYKEAQAKLSEWLTAQGYSNRVLNGDTKQEQRQEYIRGFKNKDFYILITNVQKGLNFGNCNHCIFYSFDPNPSAMVQFEGRITRDFDIVGKHVYILCSMGDEYRNLITVVRQRAKASTEFTNTDLSVVLDILVGGSSNGSSS